MGIIERIYKYLEFKGISAYEFERKCDISNGYLNSRKTGTRGIGSEILEKIYKKYPDLNLIWLITEEGEMINDSQAQPQAQPSKNFAIVAEGKVEAVYFETLVTTFREQIDTLKGSIVDKDKIIYLLEAKTYSSNKEKKGQIKAPDKK